MLNLLCGCGTIVFLIYDQWQTAFVLLTLALLFDFGDGLMARWLRAQTEIGKQLDSLADMVSFGVVPGMILFLLLMDTFQLTESDPFLKILPALPAFILTIFSALRLARFNLDLRQTEHFIGLATPSSTVFVAGMGIIVKGGVAPLAPFFSNPWVIYAVIIILSYLLLAQIEMFSFKFKHWRWKDNELRYTFVALSIGLVDVTRGSAPAWIILIYLLLNVFRRWLRSLKPFP